MEKMTTEKKYLEEYKILKASTLPNKEQMTEMSSKGWELDQIVVHKGEIFVYLKCIWKEANIIIQGYEYDTLEADSLPNEDDLAKLFIGGWELVQIIPNESKVFAYVRRKTRTGE